MKLISKFLKHNCFLIIGVLLYACARTSLADWSYVPSASMEPTLVPGDVVLIDKTTFGPSIPFVNKRLANWGAPARGDIITFVPPHTTRLFIKRVIGLPGDQIVVRGLDVYVNSKLIEKVIESNDEQALLLAELVGAKQYSTKFSKRRPISTREYRVTLPAHRYFVMGDFRNNSVDSRAWGLVEEAQIMGKVNRLLLSFARQRETLASVGLRLDN